MTAGNTDFDFTLLNNPAACILLTSVFAAFPLHSETLLPFLRLLSIFQIQEYSDLAGSFGSVPAFLLLTPRQQFLYFSVKMSLEARKSPRPR